MNTLLVLVSACEFIQNKFLDQEIPLLVEYFIDRYARKAGKKITTVDKETLRLLESRQGLSLWTERPMETILRSGSNKSGLNSFAGSELKA